MATKRLLALDVFRGATMMLMILVNTPGSWSHIYPPFQHAPWHGLTLTDLVFPFFLYIVGLSMWYSMRKRQGSGAMQRVLIRALKIFLLGMLLRAMPFTDIDWSHFRIMGVLQRIALAYAIAAILVMKLSQKQLIISSVGILLGYWGVLVMFGGEDAYGIANTIVRKVDIAILGANHLWHGHDMAFDPEGLLSTLPSVVTVILGYFTARIINRPKNLKSGISKLIMYGGACIIGGEIWGLVFPINKALWTSSYVLVTAGIGAIVLAVLLWILDEKSWTKWTFPFIVFGKNAILGFVLSNIYVKVLSKMQWIDAQGQDWNGSSYLYQQIFVPSLGSLNGSLAYALLAVLVVGLVLLVFHWRGWYLKV